MAEALRELVLTKGSAGPFEVHLVDARGAIEALAGADAASFVVSKAASDPTAVLDRRTSTGTLSIDIPGAKLTATMDQTTADALPTGVFLGEAAVRIAGKWLHSEPFFVRILPSMAPHA